MKLRCSRCGKALQVKEELAGRKVKCPSCGMVFVVPPAGTNGTVCPQCGAEMPPGAVLCVNCGYDARTGGTVETPPSETDADREEPRGRLKVPLLVCGAAVILVVLGGLVWLVVARSGGSGPAADTGRTPPAEATPPAEPSPPPEPAPSLAWEKTPVGQRSLGLDAMALTRDGGYVVAGRGRPAQQTHGVAIDAWVAKLDAQGEPLWEKCFGGEGFDAFRSVRETSDGGYILAGSTHAEGKKGSDVLVMRLDAEGNLLNSAAFGGPKNDSASDVHQTSDGGYVIAATEDSGGKEAKVWLLKLDAELQLSWEKKLGGDPPARGNCIEQTPDGGYFALANRAELPSHAPDWAKDTKRISKGWVLRLDSAGNVVWERIFKGGTQCACVTSDGGYAVGMEGGWLIRWDSNGKRLWEQNCRLNGVCDIEQTSDGAYLLAGWCVEMESAGGVPIQFRLACAVKLDAQGRHVWKIGKGGPWKTSFGHFTGAVYQWRSIHQTPDGGCIVAGAGEDWSAWILKYAPSEAEAP